MASGGWGKGWGDLPWGGYSLGGDDEAIYETVSLLEDLDVSVPFDVVEAVPITPYFVRVDFSGFVGSFPSVNLDPASFLIPGLTIQAVFLLPGYPKSLYLLTSEQSPILYNLTVSLLVESTGGDPLGANTTSFTGAQLAPTFYATAQSATKVMLTFLVQMSVDAELVDVGNYSAVKSDGTVLAISEVHVVGLEDKHVELILADPLESANSYSVQISSAIKTVGGQSIHPDVDLFHWIRRDGPMQMRISDFSGEVSSGLLGQPAGQVFFSPALMASAANSILQIENISLCTRAYDVYTLPTLPDPPILFTWPPPSGAMASSLLNGDGRLAATAERLGQALAILHDLREDTIEAPEDGPCDATLVETIDITRGGFLNDLRWETFPAATASLGVFTMADNLTPIGPGPTQNINLQS